MSIVHSGKLEGAQREFARMQLYKYENMQETKNESMLVCPLECFTEDNTRNLHHQRQGASNQDTTQEQQHRAPTIKNSTSILCVKVEIYISKG